MSASPCNDSEQLQSSLLFGLAFKVNADPADVAKFCGSTCITRLVTIAKVTVKIPVPSFQAPLYIVLCVC